MSDLAGSLDMSLLLIFFSLSVIHCIAGRTFGV